MAQGRKKTVDLDKAMTEIESIVEQLEAGELSLDGSLKQFEKGVRLSRDCQAALNQAEQTVKVLIDEELRDLDPKNLADEPD